MSDAQPPDAAPPLTPLFLLGLMRRTGTNYLFNLLCLHDQCVRGGILHEDFLSSRSDLLLAYVREVSHAWDASWQVAERMGGAELLTTQLGSALTGFLRLQVSAKGLSPKKQNARFLVTKTPSVQGLENFFALFPTAPSILLVRDGRDVVASGMRSFDWQFELAVREWASAAQAVAAFRANPANQVKPYRIVRYEDVFEKPEEELRRLFVFLGLEEDGYEWERARTLPLSGSSETRRGDAPGVHWKAVERTASFNPIGRSKEWTRVQHERFNWLAGEMLVQFGYAPVRSEDHPTYWQLWNRIHDLRWRRRQSTLE